MDKLTRERRERRFLPRPEVRGLHAATLMTEDTPETITREELAEALARRHDSSYGKGDALARALFEDIKARREPVIEPGEMYQDGIGQRFYRLSSDDGWLMLPEGVRFDDGYKFAYPLRRLVPEGRKAGHGQILAELTQWTNLPRTEAVDLAWRICKLMGGECDGDM